MTMKKFIFGFMLLALISVSSALMLSCDNPGGGGIIEEELPGGDDTLVVAVWGRYLTEATANLLKDDFIAYCASEGITHGDITFRYKVGPANTDPFYAVGDFGQAVLDDGDVNIVFPVGNNIGSAGLLTSLAGSDRKKTLAPVGDAGGSSGNRLIGYLTDDALTTKFYNDYIELDRAKAILAVDRTGEETPGGKDPGEETPGGNNLGMVVAVWGRYLTEATANLLKDDFIAYCASEGISHGDITFRYKAGANTDPFYEVAAFGQAVLDDGDVNIVLPVGSNIGSAGLLTSLAGSERKKTLASVGDAGSGSTKTNRLIGYLTDDALTAKFYNDYIELDRAKNILAIDRTGQN